MSQIELSKRHQARNLGADATDNGRRAEADTENVEEGKQVERVAKRDDRIDAGEERRLQAGQPAHGEDGDAQVRGRLAAHANICQIVCNHRLLERNARTQ